MIFSLVVLVIVVIVSGTYAYYVWTTSDSDTTKIVAGIGVATVTFDGGSDISANLRPVSDKSKGIVKNISVKGDTTGLVFNMYLDITSIDTGLKDESFRYELYKGTTKVKEGNFSDSYLTSNTVTCTKNNTNHIVLLTNESISTSKTSYTLYIWIDGANYTNPNTMMNKTFSFKLHADGEGAVMKGYTAADYITDLYTEAAKATVTNNSITYNTAPSVSLMNDRLGGTISMKEVKAWETSNNPTNNPFTSEEECLNYVNTVYRNNINNITCSSDWENNGFESETACNEAKTEEIIKENVKNFQQKMCLNSAGEFPDDTAGGNIRYYGASPDNYIYFNCETYPNTNCELWRIVGVFNGKLKIVRNSNLDDKFLIWDYDKNNDGASTGSDFDWSEASLQKLLNEKYYNGAKSGTITYYNDDSDTVTLNMANIGIKNDLNRSFISEEKWYLGGTASGEYINDVYTQERGTIKCDSCDYDTIWNGKIAMLYASDIGYSYDLTNSSDKTLSSMSSSDTWIENTFGFLLNFSKIGPPLYLSGYVQTNYYLRAQMVFPALYLTSDISIVGGTGKSDNPYLISK